jgi:hypothetical protein
VICEDYTFSNAKAVERLPSGLGRFERRRNATRNFESDRPQKCRETSENLSASELFRRTC